MILRASSNGHAFEASAASRNALSEFEFMALNVMNAPQPPEAMLRGRAPAFFSTRLTPEAFRPHLSPMPLPAETQAALPCPVAVASGTGIAVRTGSGPLIIHDAPSALALLAATPHLVCHAAYLVERLGYAAAAPRAAIRAARDQRHLDIAELFAFAAPAVAAVPLPNGLARALALTPGEDDCRTIAAVAEELLARLAHPRFERRRETAELAQFLGRARWPWAEPVFAALKHGD